MTMYASNCMVTEHCNSLPGLVGLGFKTWVGF